MRGVVSQDGRKILRDAEARKRLYAFLDGAEPRTEILSGGKTFTVRRVLRDKAR